MVDLDQEQQNVKIKKDTCKSAYTIYEGRELILNAFKSGIFPLKAIKGGGLKKY